MTILLCAACEYKLNSAAHQWMMLLVNEENEAYTGKMWRETISKMDIKRP
jgi:hypothetical protein